jgi:hypothetical protein
MLPPRIQTPGGKESDPRPRVRVIGIHSDSSPRYPGGLSAPKPITRAPRPFSLWLPRPLWFDVAAAAVNV